MGSRRKFTISLTLTEPTMSDYHPNSYFYNSLPKRQLKTPKNGGSITVKLPQKTELFGAQVAFSDGGMLLMQP